MDPNAHSGQADLRFQVSEIFLSIQGESTWAGLPCTFVRLTGCPLRCSYCDTAYAFFGGTRMELGQLIDHVKKLGCPLVELTGGEPLAQPNSLILLEKLLECGFTVLLETSGALSIAQVPREVRKIVDLKCPSSGQTHRNCYENMELLAPHDEVKFVLGTREDYEWARAQVERFDLTHRCNAVLFSCVFGQLAAATLAEWMLEDRLFEVRLQLQAHKYIWSPEARGV